MCAERTPILACILPAFNSVLAAWKDMRDDLSKSHLAPALGAGIKKMTSQYNKCRYHRPFIFAIGMSLICNTVNKKSHVFTTHHYEWRGLNKIGMRTRSSMQRGSSGRRYVTVYLLHFQDRSLTEFFFSALYI